MRELPELTLETDFGQHGIRAHEVLRAIAPSPQQGRRPASSPTEAVGEFHQLTKDTLAVVFEDIPENSSLYAALQTVDLQLVAQWMAEYLGQHEQYDELSAALDQAIRPAHFEISFGLKPRHGEKLELPSTTAPFELSCGGETVRLSGRIDRIDIGLVDGQVVFNVVDYKTGGKKRLKRRTLKPASHCSCRCTPWRCRNC